jgi:hypothetical protein
VRIKCTYVKQHLAFLCHDIELYLTFFDQSLFICDVNSGYLQVNKTEITQRQSEQTKIFKISYYIISKVLKNEMIKINEVRCTLSDS